jgi:hypothetical protein
MSAVSPVTFTEHDFQVFSFFLAKNIPIGQKIKLLSDFLYDFIITNGNGGIIDVKSVKKYAISESVDLLYMSYIEKKNITCKYLQTRVHRFYLNCSKFYAVCVYLEDANYKDFTNHAESKEYKRKEYKMSSKTKQKLIQLLIKVSEVKIFSKTKRQQQMKQLSLFAPITGAKGNEKMRKGGENRA